MLTVTMLDQLLKESPIQLDMAGPGLLAAIVHSLPDLHCVQFSSCVSAILLLCAFQRTPNVLSHLCLTPSGMLCVGCCE